MPQLGLLYLKERIQKIYANVTLFYNRLDTLRQNGEGAPTRWPDFDKLYCSADWNDKLSAVTALEEESDGKRVFFDWNYWTCAEDYSFMYASDVEVIDKTGNTGTASLTLHNGDMAVPVLLNMVFERGDWFIDEITNNWNRQPAYRYFEWKHEMERFGGLGG